MPATGMPLRAAQCAARSSVPSPPALMIMAESGEGAFTLAQFKASEAPRETSQVWNSLSICTSRPEARSMAMRELSALTEES